MATVAGWPDCAKCKHPMTMVDIRGSARMIPSGDVSNAQRRTSGANYVRPKIVCRNAGPGRSMTAGENKRPRKSLTGRIRMNRLPTETALLRRVRTALIFVFRLATVIASKASSAERSRGRLRSSSSQPCATPDQAAPVSHQK